MKRTSWVSSSRVFRRVGLATIGAAALAAGVVLPAASPAGAATSAKKLALEAVAQFRGDGKVSTVGQLHVKGASTAHVAGKRTNTGAALASTDETFTVHDRGGTFVVDLSVIGGTQTVVEVVNPASGSATDLVLAPGTDNITQEVPLSATSGSGGAPDSQTADAGDGGPSGCGSYTYSPSVIGTIYGPLIQAPSYLACLYSASLDAITALNEWVGYVKGVSSGGAGTYGTSLWVNTYAYCNNTGVYSYFATSSLFEVNGSPPWGGDSNWVALPCALI